MPDPPAQGAQPRPVQGIRPPQPLALGPGISENWKLFKQKWKNYSIITNQGLQPMSYQVALFLHTLGDDALTAYNGFHFETQEEERTVPEIIAKFDSFAIGEVSVTYERFVFNRRAQKEGENFETFLAAIRTLIRTCDYCGDCHDSILRDRIVLGVKNDDTQESLLKEQNLTLEKAISICKAAEQTSSHCASLRKPVTSSDINKVATPFKQRSSKFASPKSSHKQHVSAEKLCKFCGYKHVMKKEKCPAVGKTCTLCGEKDHFAAKCSNKKHSKSKVKCVNEQSDSDTEYVSCVHGSVDHKELHAEMIYDQKPVVFQIDCGSTVNLIPRKYIPDVPLEKCDNILSMWNKTTARPAGKTCLKLTNPRTLKKFSVEFVVVNENFTPLIGSKAAQQMKLITVEWDNFKCVHAVKDSGETVAAKYKDVFSKTQLGQLEGEVHLYVDSDATPVSRPPRPIPVTIRDKVHAELNRLIDLEVIEHVDEPSEWTSQFVATTKKNGDIRICIDPRPLNEALQRETYKLPTLDELLPNLASAKVFTKLDLTHAYWHLVLDAESRKLTTFITPWGRFRWIRLPFGIKVSSEIFQKRLHQAIGGLKGVLCKADDVIVYGSCDENHDANLENLLQRCRDKGIVLNPDKLEYKTNEITFDGHLLTSFGLKIDPVKVKAIVDMPEPKDVGDVQRLNGMVTYLSRFLPHLTDAMKPIRDLTHKGVEWKWTEVHHKAFAQVKAMMTVTPVLAYYDPVSDLEVQCDSSQFGLGAVLMQRGQPIAYASRTLTPAETRYAQIEKEALAIVFAMEKFHEYTFGNKTKVYSDHKPLESITKKDLSKAPRRLQRMLIRLQHYNIDIVFLPGNKMFIADTLSRACLKDAEVTEFDTVNMAKFLPIRQERLEQIRSETEKDETMQMLREIIIHGWPESKDNLPVQLSEYFNLRDEFSVQDGLVFRGERVMIPLSLRKTMVDRIHTAHIGVEGCARVSLLAKDGRRHPCSCFNL